MANNDFSKIVSKTPKKETKFQKISFKLFVIGGICIIILLTVLAFILAVGTFIDI